MTTPAKASEYIMGYSDEEHARLEEQASLLEPATRNVLEKIGVAKGWRCLDVACGTASVTRLLGGMVGPTGAVYAIDLDETYGAPAIRKLNSAGKNNFSFQKLDVTGEAAPDGAPFDLVYTRLLILHMAEPLKVLQNMWSWVKPGGVIVVEDYDMLPAITFTEGGRSAEGGELVRKIFAAMKKDVRIGTSIPRKFLQAGIGPSDGVEVGASFVSGKENIERIIPVLISLKPVALKFGIVADGEIETLVAAMAHEAKEPHITGRWPDLVSTWKRKAA
jgi:SAM-dependent methyltransferase